MNWFGSASLRLVFTMWPFGIDKICTARGDSAIRSESFALEVSLSGLWLTA